MDLQESVGRRPQYQHSYCLDVAEVQLPQIPRKLGGSWGPPPGPQLLEWGNQSLRKGNQFLEYGKLVP